MKKVLGILIIIVSIGLGAYLGLYVMLYGGICQILDSINPLVTKNLALGILKVLFCEIAVIPTYFGIVAGSAIMMD